MNALSERSATSGQPTTLSSDRQKANRQRKCLMCQEIFASHGIGERVCPACKSTDLWASGTSEHRLLPK